MPLTGGDGSASLDVVPDSGAASDVPATSGAESAQPSQPFETPAAVRACEDWPQATAAVATPFQRPGRSLIGKY